VNNFQRVWDGIGNESFKNLWECVVEKDDYDDSQEYKEIMNEFSVMLDGIHDPILRCKIECEVSKFTTLAMYQGFVLGFREAVKLSTV